MERHTPTRYRLDGLAAWQSASGMVAKNRDMLLAVAGAFFMLPSLFFAIMVPEPVIPAGIAGSAALQLLSDYYDAALPYLLLVTILQIAGILTLLIVMTDRARPTVGQAIGRGFRSTLSYLAAQVLYGLALGAGFVIIMTLGALSGIQAVSAALLLVMIIACVHIFLRFLLIAPVLASEPERNPVRILRRSWHLTRGQVGRMALFFGLALLLFLVVSGLIMMLVGIILAFATEGELQRVLRAVFSSAITAVALVYFVAMLAAVYRQFTGPSVEEPEFRFD